MNSPFPILDRLDALEHERADLLRKLQDARRLRDAAEGDAHWTRSALMLSALLHLGTLIILAMEWVP